MKDEGNNKKHSTILSRQSAVKNSKLRTRIKVAFRIITLICALILPQVLFAAVQQRVPTGDISATWDTIYPPTPTTHYDKVDDPIGLHDGDDTYILTATTNEDDIFGFSAFTIPSDSTSISVTVHVIAKRAQGGNSNITPRLRVNTSNYSGAGCDTYTNFSNCSYTWTTKPGTSAAWTVADINGPDAPLKGFGVLATDASPNPIVTQVYIEVTYTANTPPALGYPAAPYDDGKDPDTGDTTTDFTFKLIYTDLDNDAPAAGYPKIYIGDNDGYASYNMSLDTSAAASLNDGNYTNGEQYVYGPIGFGAAQDLRFYFEAKAATGDLTVVTLPSNAPTDYSTGPSVYLMQGYNMVGVPKDLGTGRSYSSVLGDDSENCQGCCLVWDSAGLDIAYDNVFNGGWIDCTGVNVKTGKGYFIVSNARLDEPVDVGNVTADYFDIALDPDGGWNIISNPYNVYIELEDVKVVSGVTKYTFIQAIEDGLIDNSIYEWEGFVTGYTFKACKGNPPATLEPWVGYFIYVKVKTPITLRVYKPGGTQC